MNGLLRATLIAATLAAAALALTACGSSTPADDIRADGSYTIGEDVKAGTLIRTSGSTGAASCLYKLDDRNGDPFGVSQTVKDEALYGDSSWFAPESVLSRPTLRPLGPGPGLGLPLVDGYTLIVRGCGVLVIEGSKLDLAMKEGRAAMDAADATTAAPAPAPVVTTAPAVPAGPLVNVTAAGTYVVGTDIAAGEWGPDVAPDYRNRMTTAEVASISINGTPLTDVTKPKMAGPLVKAVGWDGWDYAINLVAGDTVTISAPLTHTFHSYTAAVSG